MLTKSVLVTLVSCSLLAARPSCHALLPSSSPSPSPRPLPARLATSQAGHLSASQRKVAQAQPRGRSTPHAADPAPFCVAASRTSFRDRAEASADGRQGKKLLRASKNNKTNKQVESLVLSGHAATPSAASPDLVRAVTSGLTHSLAKQCMSAALDILHKLHAKQGTEYSAVACRPTQRERKTADSYPQ